MSTLENKLRLSVSVTDPAFLPYIRTKREKLLSVMRSADECDTWLTRAQLMKLCKMARNSVNTAFSGLAHDGHTFKSRWIKCKECGHGLELEYRIERAAEKNLP